MISKRYLTEVPFYTYLHEPGQEINEKELSVLWKTLALPGGGGEGGLYLRKIDVYTQFQ